MIKLAYCKIYSFDIYGEADVENKIFEDNRDRTWFKSIEEINK